MEYTTEQRKHAKCEVCKKDLGEKSKRSQWVRRVCFACSDTANTLALSLDLSFSEAIERLKILKGE